MKNTALFLVLIIAVLAGTAFAQDTTSKKEFRKISQSAFGLGERLEFEINYGFVTAGYATMEISPNFQVMNGRNCYDITVSINSAPSFDWVYKFREKYKCYLDAEGIFPWKFEQHLREGNYERDFEAVFDHANLKVNTTTLDKGEKKPDREHVIPMYVHDIISAFYYARTQNYSGMKEGELISIPSFYKDTTYNLNIKFLGREDEDVPAGEFRCFMVQPLVKEGALTSKAEDIILWISDDDRKIPVKIQLSIIIGSVKTELKGYSNLSGPLNSKK